jgi:hypothetical protein
VSKSESNASSIGSPPLELLEEKFPTLSDDVDELLELELYPSEELLELELYPSEELLELELYPSEELLELEFELESLNELEELLLCTTSILLSSDKT